MKKYDIGYLSLLPVIYPVYLYKKFFKNKYHESVPGMLGKNLSDIDFGIKPIWLHSVSVGETVAAKSLINPLKTFFPEKDIVISTVTETGNQKARQIIKEAKTVFYYPFDFSWNVNRFIDKINPYMYIFLETELWPNFLCIAGERKIPIFLVNGKISDKSFHKYLKFNFLFRHPLNNISAFLMQTESDAEKISKLTGSSKNVYVTGNIKFDSLPNPLSFEEKTKLKEELKLTDKFPIIVIGSTHPGEEKIFIEILKKLKIDFPKISILIVPRHPERFNEVSIMLEKSSVNFSRLSLEESLKSDSEIILIDKMGVLGKIFGIADIAVVGGSYTPIGGHNLLEPAVHSIPVITGPHTFSQKEIMRVMNEENACLEVNESDLYNEIVKLIKDKNLRDMLGLRAKKAVDKNKGSAKRSIEILQSILEKQGKN